MRDRLSKPKKKKGKAPMLKRGFLKSGDFEDKGTVWMGEESVMRRMRVEVDSPNAVNPEQGTKGKASPEGKCVPRILQERETVNKASFSGFGVEEPLFEELIEAVEPSAKHPFEDLAEDWLDIEANK